MVINIFHLIGALGLIFIIIGVLIKERERRKRNILYIIGGIFLASYSIYIKDIIFIILQFVFIIVSVYDLTLQTKKAKSK